MPIATSNRWQRRTTPPPPTEGKWEWPWQKWAREHPGEPWFKWGGRGYDRPPDPHTLVSKEGEPHVTMGAPMEEYEKYYMGGAKILSLPQRTTPSWEVPMQKQIWEKGRT